MANPQMGLIDERQLLALCQNLVDRGTLQLPANSSNAHPAWWGKYDLELDNVDSSDVTISALGYPPNLSALELHPDIRRSLVVDEVTMRDLKLLELTSAIDLTQTTSGYRMLEYLVHFPLRDKDEITKRQAAIGELSENLPLVLSLGRYFKTMAKNERGFVEFTFPQEGDAPPRQETLQATRVYLACIPQVVALLKRTKSDRLGELRENLEHLLRKDKVRKMYESVVDGSDMDIMRLHPETWRDSMSQQVVETLKSIAPIIGALRDAHIRADMSNGEFKLVPRQTGEAINVRYPLGLTLDLKKVHKHYFDQGALFSLYYTAALIEALCSLAGLESKLSPVNMGFLEITEGERFDCSLEAPANPYYLIKQGKFVPNDYSLDAQTRGFIVTGPNTGGKTVYGFTLPTLQSLTQTGAKIPVLKGRTTLADHIFTLRPASKEQVGEGRYLHSLVRGREIFENATPRSVVAIDDFEGTDPEDCYQESLVLARKLRRLGCAFIMTTQDRRVALCIEKNEGGEFNGIRPVQLEYEATDKDVVFHYRVIPGVGESIGGVCAKAAKMDDAGLDALLTLRGY
jgi:DNA mismatch repair ATPase MutS